MKVILALFLFEVQTFAGWLSRDKVDRSRIEVIQLMYTCMGVLIQCYLFLDNQLANLCRV